MVTLFRPEIANSTVACDAVGLNIDDMSSLDLIVSQSLLSFCRHADIDEVVTKKAGYQSNYWSIEHGDAVRTQLSVLIEARLNVAMIQLGGAARRYRADHLSRLMTIHVNAKPPCLATMVNVAYLALTIQRKTGWSVLCFDVAASRSEAKAVIRAADIARGYGFLEIRREEPALSGSHTTSRWSITFGFPQRKSRFARWTGK